MSIKIQNAMYSSGMLAKYSGCAARIIPNLACRQYDGKPCILFTTTPEKVIAEVGGDPRSMKATFEALKKDKRVLDLLALTADMSGISAINEGEVCEKSARNRTQTSTKPNEIKGSKSAKIKNKIKDKNNITPSYSPCEHGEEPASGSGEGKGISTMKGDGLEATNVTAQTDASTSVARDTVNASPCVSGLSANASATPSSKGRSRRLSEPSVNCQKIEYTEDFNVWWEAYPAQRRSNKFGCFKVWQDLIAYEVATAEELTLGLMAYLNSEKWHKEDGRYVSEALKFLETRMWEDEPKAWWRREVTKIGRYSLPGTEVKSCELVWSPDTPSNSSANDYDSGDDYLPYESAPHYEVPSAVVAEVIAEVTSGIERPRYYETPVTPSEPVEEVKPEPVAAPVAPKPDEEAKRIMALIVDWHFLFVAQTDKAKERRIGEEIYNYFHDDMGRMKKEFEHFPNKLFPKEIRVHTGRVESIPHLLSLLNIGLGKF